MVPLALWIVDLPRGVDGGAAAGRGGFLFGALHFGLVLHWVAFALGSLTVFAPLVYAALVGVLALACAAVVRLVHFAVREAGAPLWVALPVAWTGLEWALAHAPSTLAFPWLGLGTSLTAFPELVGIAELVGARGVTFWVVLVNALVAATLLDVRMGGAPASPAQEVVRGKARHRVAIVAVVLGLPMAWGVWRAGTLELRSVATVGVVQPDVRQELRFRGEEGRAATLTSLDRLLGGLQPGAVDLVVLPEVVLDVFARDPAAAPSIGRLQGHSRELGAPLLFGALARDAGGSPLNSAFLLEPRGLSEVRYDKHRLVPFVERAPFASARFGRAGRAAGSDASGAVRGSFAPGRERTLFVVDEARFGVLICYEAAFASEARRWRLEGADALANLTNDGWYGSAEVRTGGLWQHPAHLVMRAIENRMGVARAANTGISLFVDPVGRIHEASALFVADVRVAEVVTTDVLTLYTRLGDVVGSGSALAALLLLVGGIARGRAGGGTTGRIRPRRG